MNTTTQYIKREDYQLDFKCYQLMGTDLFRDSLLTERLSFPKDLEQGMTVYSTGMLGETLEIQVTEVDGDGWTGENKYAICWGRWQPTRFVDVAMDDIGGWAMEGMGSKEALQRFSLADF